MYVRRHSDKSFFNEVDLSTENNIYWNKLCDVQFNNICVQMQFIE